MQNMVKEIPLQYLTPNQFKRWTASIGFSGKKCKKWFHRKKLPDPTHLAIRPVRSLYRL